VSGAERSRHVSPGLNPCSLMFVDAKQRLHIGQVQILRHFDSGRRKIRELAVQR